MGAPSFPQFYRGKGGNHEPQPAAFFFQNFAENYRPILHTMEEKERGMNRKEKGESRALGIKLSRTHPSPPTIFIFPLKTFADNYKNNEINNIRC